MWVIMMSKCQEMVNTSTFCSSSHLLIFLINKESRKKRAAGALLMDDI